MKSWCRAAKLSSAYRGTKETYCSQAFQPDSEPCQAGMPDLLPCRGNIIVTLVRSQAKSWVAQPGSDRIRSAISPQAVLSPAGSPAAADSSRASSFRGRSSARRMSIVPCAYGPRGMSRPLSRREARPVTDSSRSQSDSMSGFRGGHPNRRVRRSRRADRHPAGSGRVIRSGRGSRESRSIDSQPLRRRIKCSDTRDDLNGPLAGWLPGTLRAAPAAW